jgi:hypothetical protein
MNIEHLSKYHEKMFDIIIIVSYILIVISALGLSQTAPSYLDKLDTYLKIYVCLFLIWRFNPFRKNVLFNELDKKIAFSAGLFILTTTILNNYLIYIQNILRSIIKGTTFHYL